MSNSKNQINALKKSQAIYRPTVTKNMETTIHTAII